ncbi:putative histone-lysine N-methyltransferase, H3 lysine-79 specific [Cercophora samala]|uniref:Histone-lysine N-methyltransferase, H3 lysine-79 specific n=1 Tax=Cercophora samala TaxID=330535 RepID=A0AA39ZNH2_9PEZI|nr:putative histone-lysine N-methyltransferase, H3 lysine-79 specific [Cercophora samala]
MSIFNQKSKFKVKTEVRAVKKTLPEKPKPKPTSTPSSASRIPSSSARASPSTNSTPRASPLPPSARKSQNGSSRYLDPSSALKSSSTSNSRKRPRASHSPASPSFDSDSDSDSASDDDWQDQLDPRKRLKRLELLRRHDPNRRVRHPKVWKGDRDSEGELLPIIHAVEVASLSEKCQPVMGLSRDEVGVRLRYPGSNHREKYELVKGKDKIEGAQDILNVVRHVASIYLSEEEARPFLDQNSGIYRRLERCKNLNDGKGFKAALKEYSESLFALQRKGVIAKNLESMRGVPQELVSFILDQVYDRTVAPKVDLLAKYENGTDNVYGELLHPFISDIFERTRLTSDMVFVDLGSGVGNVVLQAALEIGCESWGCEMMENACNLADAQKKEFAARCRLWGIAPGKVYLERGDFRKNEPILESLKRADVVLVNNQAFTSQLNDNLVNMFLDLKIGCKIVSLKTFVHDNKLAENDVASSILDVEHLTYPEEYVSWTGAAGTYCISTRK